YQRHAEAGGPEAVHFQTHRPDYNGSPGEPPRFSTPITSRRTCRRARCPRQAGGARVRLDAAGAARRRLEPPLPPLPVPVYLTLPHRRRTGVAPRVREFRPLLALAPVQVTVPVPLGAPVPRRPLQPRARY